MNWEHIFNYPHVVVPKNIILPNIRSQKEFTSFSRATARISSA